MLIKAASKTDVGKRRSLNEDKIGMYEKENVYLVCDGMGGQVAGSLASDIAVETIINYVKLTKNNNFSSLQPKLKESFPSKACDLIEAIRLSNRRIFNLALKYPNLRGMGTTVASVFLDNGYIYIAHVGDSRVYRLRKGKIDCLTQDHSWVNELLQDKEITKEEAKDFRQKNVITRALGTKSTVKVDLRIESVFNNDLFVLCSDGLSGVVEDKEICETVLKARGNVNLACENLVDLANKKGGPDNISVVIVAAKNRGKEKNFQGKSLSGSVVTVPEEQNTVLRLEDELLTKMYGELDIKKIDMLVGKKKFWQKPLYIGGIMFIGALILVPVLFNKGTQKVEQSGKILLPEEEKVIAGKVNINTSPPGAVVSVDGHRSIKITPTVLSLPVKKEKPYKITLDKVGYKKKVIIVFVVANDEIKINEPLIPQAEINLVLGFDKEFPEDAEVYIDDQQLALSMEQLRVIQTKALAKGEHTIEIKRKDKVLWQKVFSLLSDEVKSIVIE